MRALIIGIRGQDGTFLKKILVRNEYDVFGVLRPGAHMGSNWQNDVTQSITKKQLEKDIRIDLADSNLCNEYLNLIKPDRIFHLAAEHAPASEMASVENNKSKEMYKCHVTLTQNLLEWVKLHTKTRLVVALTSQMYSPSLFQNKITEKNIYAPQNLYSKTKLEGFNLLKKYRQEYGLFANGLILFNHTSAIAKPTYLFGEIAQQLVEFKNQERQYIYIQNARQKIDICDASEVCEAIYRSIEYDFPKDYVISSGRINSIESIIVEAAQLLKIEFSKKNICSLQKKKKFAYIHGDPTEAFKHLNWEAQKTPAQILRDMVNSIISNQSAFEKNN
jgi:GDPmannose 4,6-dehydratase